MARRKTPPATLHTKQQLSERLRQLRTELFGERGGPELARRLGLPVRTWYNYENGVTIPAEVLLRLVELTDVEPLWLLNGREPKFRMSWSRPGLATSPAERPDPARAPVASLLRTALRHLEQQESRRPYLPEAATRPVLTEPQAGDQASVSSVVLMGVENADWSRVATATGPRYVAALRDWLAARRDCRCVRVAGEAMRPILADGAYVAFADTEEDLDALDGKLVLTWIENQPIVRWFERSGHFALLRAENPACEPSTLLLDLNDPDNPRRFRRVLWVSTPHE